MTTEKRNAMVGKFFHTYENGNLSHQGHILANPETGFYLVEYFEWITGFPSTEEVVSIAKMEGWTLFDCVEDMRSHYEHVERPKAEREPKKPNFLSVSH